MTKILPVDPDILVYLKRHNLAKKFNKQIALLENNLSYPSLHVERLEPKARGIYSFRVDIKYRALFIFRDDLRAIEILAATKHYKR